MQETPTVAGIAELAQLAERARRALETTKSLVQEYRVIIAGSRPAQPNRTIDKTEVRRSQMTELEFVLRTTRALVSAYPDKAIDFLKNALGQTIDPRLRHLIEPALAAVARNDAVAARKWIDRACEYIVARRP
jgi:hypothetical protein